MTGKELISYILYNDLVYKELEFEDLMSAYTSKLYTVEKAAVKLGMGTESVKTLYKLRKLSGVEIKGELYIYIKD